MRTVFKNCILLDGSENMKPVAGVDVAVEDGIIAGIGQIDSASADKVIDLEGRYLMPGLINLHVHLPAGGKPQKKPMNAKLLAKLALSSPFMKKFALNLCHGYSMQALLSGVTTVRAVGGLGSLDTVLRDKINNGDMEGPRLLVSNYAIGVPDGHMDGSVAKAANSPEEAEEMVEELASQGVDLIKLMITGGVMDAKVKGEPGQLRMSREMIKACCDAAHRYSLKVAAHVQSPEGVRAAIENGVDSIEHGSVLTDKETDVFLERGAALVCTLSPAFPMAKFERSVLGISEEVQYNSELVYNNMVKGAGAALEKGIPVGLGTDTGCPYTTHYNMWRELYLFSHAVDVSPEFTLYSATLGNAKIAGIDRLTGSIEVGKCADILISDKSPLEDFRNLSSPYAVMARGKLYLKPKIKKYPGCDEELDKYDY